MTANYASVLDAIRSYDTIIIHRHQKPDPDAIGSQVGLASLIRQNFPTKRVLTTGNDEPTLSFMATMDKVSNADYQGSLVIVTDTANLARIDDDRYNLGDHLIKIDHHPNDEPYGEICLVDTRASSCSEMIAELAFEQRLEVTTETARLLYAGIVGDTGRFLYPNTTAKTLRIASRLLETGFDAALITRQMDTFPPKIARLMGYVLEHLEVNHSGAAQIVLNQELLQSLDITTSEVSLLVSLPGKIDTVASWMICTEQADGHYRVNLRSKQIPINQIAKQHDGGGHPLASGAWAYSTEEIEQIFQKLQTLLLSQEGNSIPSPTDLEKK